MSNKVPDDVQALPKASGRYQMLGEIGRGGMGIVYKGRDQDLGREVAMKVLRDEYAARADVLARFVEEAQIGGQLQHPGIVPVYELGLQAGERPYFAMKLIQGETLAGELARRGSLEDDRRRFLGVFEQVCQTMAYAHSRHVVHRDLKPANVMIGAFGEVQVVDWGFAKVLGSKSDTGAAPIEPAGERGLVETSRSRGESGSQSIEGSMMGTPAYMPPEQALGNIECVDERSDVFSLGAVLCEILTGEPPYREEDGNVVLQAARAELDGARARLTSCGADAALTGLALECLSAEREARPATATLLAQRVTGYLTSVEERARQADLRAVEARLRTRATLISAAAGILVLALGAAVWMWMASQAQERRTAATQRVAEAGSSASAARGRAQAAGFDALLWSAAVTSADQLASLAKNPDVEPLARADAMALFAAIADEAKLCQAESARRARDRRMLEELELARIPADEDVRLHQIDDLHRLDAAYAAAFTTYLGEVSLLEAPSESVLESLRRGDIEVELAATLDHWGLVRDALPKEPDAPDAGGTALLREIATELDPSDPWRVELRALLPRAALENSRLSELVRKADFSALPAVSGSVLAEALWIAGEKETAVTVLSRARELNPRDFDLCFKLALSLEALDEPRTLEAIAAYRIAQAIRPEQHEVLHRQLLAARRLGLREDDERLSRRLAAIDPTSSHWRQHVGMALFDQGRDAEALESYRQALELDPKNALVHGDIGSLLLRQGDLKAGTASYRRAIEINPYYMLGHSNLGLALAQQGQFEEALTSVRHAIEIWPRDPRPHCALGVVLAEQGHLDEAIASLRRSIELDPNDPSCHSQLGAALIRQGKSEEALVSVRRAIELAPRDGPSNYNLGLLLEEQGKHDEALASFRLAAGAFASWQASGWRAEAEKRIEEVEEVQSRGLEQLALARGESEPRDGAALAESAYSVYRRNEFLLSARTYARAFEAMPGLLAIYPHRYNAACAAALAGCGKGAGAAELLAPERGAWRARARGWLSDELAALPALLAGSATERAAALLLLETVRTDPDFALVRDAEGLNALPADEAQAWRVLWQGFAALGASVEDKR